VDQASDLLRRKGRITYRSLKLEFTLDDEQLDVLKEELIEGQKVAVDENEKVLVWVGREEDETAKGGKSKKETDAEARTPNSELSSGERRQLTVMFIDLVGSTTLSQQLDPEDYHSRVRAYQAACRQAVTCYDG
jgi:hypothetical protein